jgi:hypothetical protein
MPRQTTLAGLVVLAICGTALLLYGGRVRSNDKRAAKKKSIEVTCHFAYRTSTQIGKLDEKKIRVTIPVSDNGIEIARIVKPKQAEFNSIRVEVQHNPNSLIVRVYEKDTKRMIVSNLFQFGPDLRNLFHGGHGFTGLNYVYHSKNKSELQFWCSVGK